ncbi:hypothetical protein [Campylobacter troglodytis]|nr:hypothetical protein [Campylobacter troglodytis]
MLIFSHSLRVKSLLHYPIHARARNLAQNSDFAYANISTKTL